MRGGPRREGPIQESRSEGVQAEGVRAEVADREGAEPWMSIQGCVKTICLRRIQVGTRSFTHMEGTMRQNMCKQNKRLPANQSINSDMACTTSVTADRSRVPERHSAEYAERSNAGVGRTPESRAQPSAAERGRARALRTGWAEHGRGWCMRDRKKSRAPMGRRSICSSRGDSSRGGPS